MMTKIFLTFITPTDQALQLCRTNTERERERETSVKVCEYINLTALSEQQASQQGQVVSHVH